MRRRDFIAATGCAVGAWPFAVRAQQAAVPVVGWLHIQPLNTSQHFIAAFRRGLGEADFVEGKNLALDLRPADGRPDRLPELAVELVRRRVAVIMAGAAPSAFAAKRATSTIPIVFTSGADPVKIGLVSSLNRPGGNVTGFHLQFGELVGKRVTLLHEMAPHAARMAVLVNPANLANVETLMRNAGDEARALGLEFQVFNASSGDEINSAFAALALWRAGTLLVGDDPLFADQRARVSALAVRHGIPISGWDRSLAEAGALMSYGPDTPAVYAQAGVYVGRILKGEKPSELPVQQPTKYELAINVKTAKAIGLDVPTTLLALADVVIE